MIISNNTKIVYDVNPENKEESSYILITKELDKKSSAMVFVNDRHTSTTSRFIDSWNKYNTLKFPEISVSSQAIIFGLRKLGLEIGSKGFHSSTEVFIRNIYTKLETIDNTGLETYFTRIYAAVYK